MAPITRWHHCTVCQVGLRANLHSLEVMLKIELLIIFFVDQTLSCQRQDDFPYALLFDENQSFPGKIIPCQWDL